MIALMALFRAQPGQGDAMAAALAEMTRYVAASEPGTRGFYVCRDESDPLGFITYERFTDQAALETHNSSAYRDRWIAQYGALFDGALVRHSGPEIACKHG